MVPVDFVHSRLYHSLTCHECLKAGNKTILKCGEGPHFVLFIDKGCKDADGRVVCSIGCFCHCSVFLHIKIHNHRQHLTTELAELPVIIIIIIV